MRTARLGRTNLEVTRWSLGGIPLSTVMGGTKEDDIEQVIHAALDSGINLIDTSRIYMDSETNIGKIMKDRRKECFLATKSLSRNRDEVLADIEESLKELMTDKIDIMQMHHLQSHDIPQVLGKGGAMEGIKKARDEGLVDFIGATSHHIDVLISLVKTGEFDTIMFPFNVIERVPEKELIALAKERDIGSIVMKPIAGGVIKNRGKSFRFFNAYPVDTILNGVANVNELRENLALIENITPLSAQELKAFEDEAAPLGKDFCRRCNYCQPCPSDIIILDVIHMFYQSVQGVRYEDLSPAKQETGRNLLNWLEACAECGECEKKCPYNLPTIQRKNELLKIFAGR